MSAETNKLLTTALYILLAIFAIWLIFASARMFIFAKTAGKLINQLEPYNQVGTGSEDILFIGDSFAYGTGASSSENTIAGLFGKHFPEATITNKAKNGAKTSDLAMRISSDIDRHYDIIVVIVGANDIIHPEVNLAATQCNLADIYNYAASRADNVIAITTGDFRDVSFFLTPLNYYFGHRSDKVGELAKKEASRFKNVTYVDGYDKSSKPYGPKALESADHLHLNDLGMYYWFQRILEKTNGLKF